MNAAPGKALRADDDVSLRPFGEAADLDLDFRSADRPGLVTALLAQCDARGDASHWWAQPVGRRTAALLRLLTLTEGRAEIRLSASCTQPACGKPFEFELPLQALPTGTAGDAPVAVRLDAQRSATLRRPTGDDLRRWRDAAPASRDDAVRAMLETLLIGGDANVADEQCIADAVAAMDPLVAFAVSCRCPACGADTDVGVDLEALALRRLSARQRALLHEVHRFACAYGWTEAETLAVPSARRARYLELIDGP